MSRIAAYWGLGGFLLLILQALFRFYPTIMETVTGPHSAGHWLGVSLSVVLFGLGKGYFVLQRRFAPRFTTRVRELATAPTRMRDGLLAPFYCLNLVGAEKKALMRGYLLVGAIVLMIVAAKQLPDSWYGPVIVGVAVALAWGAVAVAIQAISSMSLDSEADASRLQAAVLD